MASSSNFVGSIVSAFILLAVTSTSFAEDAVVMFADDDMEMNAAIGKARSTLPYFWQRLASPGEGEQHFSVKLKITDGLAAEHFWCDPVVGTASRATCNISNEPQSVSTVQYGQRMSIEDEFVTDWMFTRDGKIIGGETIRVIMTRLSKEEAEQLGLEFGEP